MLGGVFLSSALAKFVDYATFVGYLAPVARSRSSVLAVTTIFVEFALAGIVIGNHGIAGPATIGFLLAATLTSVAIAGHTGDLECQCWSSNSNNGSSSEKRDWRYTTSVARTIRPPLAIMIRNSVLSFFVVLAFFPSALSTGGAVAILIVFTGIEASGLLIMIYNERGRLRLPVHPRALSYQDILEPVIIMSRKEL